MSRVTFSTYLVVLAAIVPLACADQPEGARCDTDNGDSDCAAGLYCTSSSQLAGTKPTGLSLDWGLCCPPAGATITSDACQRNAAPTGAGATPGTGGSDSGAAPDSNPGAGGTSPDGSSSGGASGSGGSSGATGGAPAAGGGSPSDAATEGG